jgi:ribose transport system ATP-binding protein
MQVTGVEKTYGSTRALRGVDLALAHGEILGLLGENGSGKSTLLRIMAGVEPADRGRVLLGEREVHGHDLVTGMGHGIGLVFQELSLLPNQTVAEAFFLPAPALGYRFGLHRRRALERQCGELLTRYGVEAGPGDEVGRLPFHERQLLEILRALELPKLLGAERTVVLLDEATTALGDREVERLFAVMRSAASSSSSSFVVVSHRLAEMLEISDRLLVLRDGAAVAERVPSATSEDELHGLMVGRERSADYFHDDARATIADDSVLEVRGATSEGFSDVTLHVRAGEIVGLAGLQDSGKSELCEAIFGLRKLRVGELRVAGRAVSAHPHHNAASGIAYVPKERLSGGIIEDFSITENVGLHLLRRSAIVRNGERERAASTVISEFGVKASSPQATLSTLSGGNQQKVAIGKWLIEEPRLLILDNPTRGVDVGARTELYAALRRATQRGAAILVACDELTEILGLCDRAYVMRDGRLSAALDIRDQTVTERELVAHMM